MQVKQTRPGKNGFLDAVFWDMFFSWDKGIILWLRLHLEGSWCISTLAGIGIAGTSVNNAGLEIHIKSYHEIYVITNTYLIVCVFVMACLCFFVTYLYEFGLKLSQGIHWLPGSTIAWRLYFGNTVPLCCSSMLYIFECNVLDILNFAKSDFACFRRLLDVFSALSIIWLFQILICNTIFNYFPFFISTLLPDLDYPILFHVM